MDPLLYTADVSIVDLGLVRDVRVRGEVVTIVLTTPHRGRPLASYFDYGFNAVHSTPSKSIQDAVRGVAVASYPGLVRADLPSPSGTQG